MPQTHHNIIAQVDADIAIRTETFLGVEYTVVPVVAMIEGVRQGVSQSNPELGLAEEFGKIPQTWNNRPVVMNHPVINGNLVSANTLDVLETYSFGFTANASIENGKLKMEAWLSNTRMTDLGGEVQEIAERIEDNEIIEVSVGFYSDVEQKKGSFKGQSYSGIWRNIVPDHLAFLSKGSVGACSVEAGCGTPRVNQGVSQVSKTSILPSLFRSSKPNAAAPQTTNTRPGSIAAPSPHGQCSCGGGGAQVVESAVPGDSQSESPPDITANLMDTDKRALVSKALSEKGEYVYLIGIEDDSVIYEMYDMEGSGYRKYSRGFSINGTSVTFSGDPVEVDVIMQVVPKGETMTTNSATPASASAPEATASTPTPETPVVETPAPAPAPAAVTQAAKPLTAQEFIDSAPAEIRDMLSSGLQLHTQRKATLIKALKDTGRCKFDDVKLNGMSVDDLQNLVDLSAAPDYSGRRGPEAPAPVAQAANDAFVPAPKAFEKKVS
jgi:hypothetical protein